MNLPASTPADIALWEDRVASVSAAWRSCLAAIAAQDAVDMPQWARRVEELRAHQADLMDRGAWRGGPRTLLAALDLQFRELAMTAGLAWLVRPDGHHGLGSAALRALLARLGVEPTESPPGGVRIVLEEARDDTRADLVVYGGTWTVVVEAKTFASEQPDQLDRLYDNWAHEPGARFVFLTRGQRVPVTSVRSYDVWSMLTWRDVADLVTSAAASRPGIAAGVFEYLDTLEAYHRV